MNNDVSKSNSLTDLAARIRESHEAVRFALKSSVEHAMTTGDLLLEAKVKLDQHGKWQPWLRQHCRFSERTARLYMRLAKNRRLIEASGDVTDLTLNSTARLLAPSKQEDDKLDDKIDDAIQALADATQDMSSDEKLDVMVDLCKAVHVAPSMVVERELELARRAERR